MEITLTKANRFRIDCSVAENQHLADMPAKRFYKKGRCWMAPVLARNAEFLLLRFRDSMSEAATVAAEQAVERVRIRRVPFPGWYPYKTIPMKHQAAALDYTWGLRRYALHMEMGTGKTKIGVDRICAKYMDRQIGVGLVFCPVAVRRVWVREFETHAPIPVETFIIRDMEVKRNQAAFKKALETVASGSKLAVFIVGAESLSQGFQKGRAYEHALQVVTAGVPVSVVNDESHLFKSPDSSRALNVEFLTQNAHDMGNLTGTPVSQGPLDLYMQFQILDPNILGFGDFYSFRNHFAEMGGFENREIVQYKNLDQLAQLTGPVTFTVTKDEVLDLPPKVMTTRYVQLSPEQRKAYNEIDKQGEATILSGVRDGHSVELIVEAVLAEYNSLTQITAGFAMYDDPVTGAREMVVITPPGKNPKVQELLAVLADHPERQAIVWCKFKQEIAGVAQALEAEGVSHCVYTGATSHEDRATYEDQFNAGNIRVFISNAATGGTGLTLNAASLVVYMSNDFRLIYRQQSEDRCHRKGQTKSVVYIDIVAENTKDEDIAESLQSKQDVAAYIRDRVKAEMACAGRSVVV